MAHHAFSAEFDANQPITLKGKVTKIAWTNPHVWIYVNVQDESGKLTNWGFEMGAPHQVQGRGWTRDTVKIGDELVVVGSRARDGSNRMNARNVTWAATGKTLGAGVQRGRCLHKVRRRCIRRLAMRRRVFFAACMATAVLSSCRPDPSDRLRKAARSRPRTVRPAPRTPDGKIILGSPAGEKGTWNAVDNRIAIPEKPEEFGDRDSAANFPDRRPRHFQSRR